MRNKFITSQQSCDLRRYLDGAAPEASIGDIVDSCRIWESHAEPLARYNWCHNQVYSQPTLLKPSQRHAVQRDAGVDGITPEGDTHFSDRELLIRNVLEGVGARRNVMSERSRNRELELLL